MESFNTLDRECSALAGLFQLTISDMKTCSPLWEEFLSRTAKLQTSLKGTLTSVSAFLDAFQRIADHATNSRGASTDVGATLTRLCLRHREVLARVRVLTNALLESTIQPLHARLDDWKRTTVTLDREHTKEYKKGRSELKKKTDMVTRLHKKAKKSNKPETNKILAAGIEEVMTGYTALVESERNSLRKVLLEERGRYCLLARAVTPILVEEVGLVGELSHLQDILQQLHKHTADSGTLPPATEQVLQSIKDPNTDVSWHTPPSSPSSLSGSHRSSHRSSLTSITSTTPPPPPPSSHHHLAPPQSSSTAASSSSSLNASPSHLQQHNRSRSASQSGGYGGLLSSSSRDSGFTSLDALHRHHHSISLGGVVLRRGHLQASRVSDISNLSQPSSLGSSNDGGCHSSLMPPPTAQASSSTDSTTTTMDRPSDSSSGTNSHGRGGGGDTSTWPNSKLGSSDGGGTNASGGGELSVDVTDRPHTISSAYEKSHVRPALGPHTFTLPASGSKGQSSSGGGGCSASEDKADGGGGGSCSPHGSGGPQPPYTATISRRSSRSSLIQQQQHHQSASNSQESINSQCSSSGSNSVRSKPPLPSRCSSLERPTVPEKKHSASSFRHRLPQPLHHLLHHGSQGSSSNVGSSKSSSSAGGSDATDQQTTSDSLVPDFNQAPPDMIVPQPVYSNMSELDGGGENSPHGSLSSSGYGSQPSVRNQEELPAAEDCQSSKYTSSTARQYQIPENSYSSRGCNGASILADVPEGQVCVDTNSVPPLDLMIASAPVTHDTCHFIYPGGYGSGKRASTAPTTPTGPPEYSLESEECHPMPQSHSAYQLQQYINPPPQVTSHQPRSQYSLPATAPAQLYATGPPNFYQPGPNNGLNVATADNNSMYQPGVVVLRKHVNNRGSRTGSLRRSLGGKPPAPPIRRTPSISSSSLNNEPSSCSSSPRPSSAGGRQQLQHANSSTSLQHPPSSHPSSPAPLQHALSSASLNNKQNSSPSSSSSPTLPPHNHHHHPNQLMHSSSSTSLPPNLISHSSSSSSLPLYPAGSSTSLHHNQHSCSSSSSLSNGAGHVNDLSNSSSNNGSVMTLSGGDHCGGSVMTLSGDVGNSTLNDSAHMEEHSRTLVGSSSSGGGAGVGGSEASTPRGSVDNFPPPPDFLLHDDSLLLQESQQQNSGTVAPKLYATEKEAACHKGDEVNHGMGQVKETSSSSTVHGTLPPEELTKEVAKQLAPIYQQSHIPTPQISHLNLSSHGSSQNSSPSSLDQLSPLLDDHPSPPSPCPPSPHGHPLSQSTLPTIPSASPSSPQSPQEQEPPIVTSAVTTTDLSSYSSLFGPPRPIQDEGIAKRTVSVSEAVRNLQKEKQQAPPSSAPKKMASDAADQSSINSKKPVNDKLLSNNDSSGGNNTGTKQIKPNAPQRSPTSSLMNPVSHANPQRKTAAGAHLNSLPSSVGGARGAAEFDPYTQPLPMKLHQEELMMQQLRQHASTSSSTSPPSSSSSSVTSPNMNSLHGTTTTTNSSTSPNSSSPNANSQQQLLHLQQQQQHLQQLQQQQQQIIQQQQQLQLQQQSLKSNPDSKAFLATLNSTLAQRPSPPYKNLSRTQSASGGATSLPNTASNGTKLGASQIKTQLSASLSSGGRLPGSTSPSSNSPTSVPVNKSSVKSAVTSAAKQKTKRSIIMGTSSRTSSSSPSSSIPQPNGEGTANNIASTRLMRTGSSSSDKFKFRQIISSRSNSSSAQHPRESAVSALAVGRNRISSNTTSIAGGSSSTGGSSATSKTSSVNGAASHYTSSR